MYLLLCTRTNCWTNISNISMKPNATDQKGAPCLSYQKSRADFLIIIISIVTWIYRSIEYTDFNHLSTIDTFGISCAVVLTWMINVRRRKWFAFSNCLLWYKSVQPWAYLGLYLFKYFWVVLYAYVVGQLDQYLSYLVVIVIYNELQRKRHYQIAYHVSVLLKILLNIDLFITVSIRLTTVCLAPNMYD